MFGKIFTKVLNWRLVSYVELNMFYEEQAGYRSGYSTIDNIFILQSVVQKYITKQKEGCIVYLLIFLKLLTVFSIIFVFHSH